MSTRTTAQTLGPCTDCDTPHDACTGPDYCCGECLHFAADWDGYAQPAAAEPTGDLREQIAEWMDGPGRSHDEHTWRGVDDLLALPAVRNALAAQEAVKRVQALAEDDAEVARVARKKEAAAKIIGEQNYWLVLAGVREQSADRIRRALAGDS